jgi:hypothetical protein
MEMLKTYFMRMNELHKIVYSQMNDQKKENMKHILKRIGSNIKESELDKYLNLNTQAGMLDYKELKDTKVFTLESNDVVELLKKTDNKIHNRKLPFDNMFVECELKTEDATFYGFHLLKDKYGIIAKLLFQSDEMPQGMTFRGVLPISDKFSYEDDVVDEGIRDYMKRMRNETEGLLKRGKKEVATLICNFIDFINNPEVEIVTVDRSEERNEKRLLRGKPPIPTVKHVRVTGKLKIYLNELQSGREITYSHRFWVRGHFRTLRSEKWKNKQGMKIWIPPFVKGKGILVDKVYEVHKTDGEFHSTETHNRN